MQSWLTIGSLIAATVRSTAGRNRSWPIRIWWCVGVELLGDDVGVGELVAALPGRRLEADAERGQPALALLGQQRHDVAGVEPAGEQHPDRHVGDHPPLDRGPQRRRGSASAHSSRVDGLATRVCDGLPVDASRWTCRPRLMTRTVAGGSLRTPATIVRGAGTTEWNVM